VDGSQAESAISAASRFVHEKRVVYRRKYRSTMDSASDTIFIKLFRTFRSEVVLHGAGRRSDRCEEAFGV
jgi:hypothetical protein